MTTNKYPCYFEGQESYILLETCNKLPHSDSGYETLYSAIANCALDNIRHRHTVDAIKIYSRIKSNPEDYGRTYKDILKSRIDFCINNFLTDDQAAAITLLYGLYQDKYDTRIGFDYLYKFIKGPTSGYWYSKENNYPDNSNRNIKKDSLIILSRHINDIRYGKKYRDMMNKEDSLRKETDYMFEYFGLFKDTSNYLRDYKKIYLKDTKLSDIEINVLHDAGIDTVGELIDTTKKDDLDRIKEIIGIKKFRGYNYSRLNDIKQFAAKAVELDTYLSSIDEGLKEIRQNVCKEPKAATQRK